jgi:hypothetical protein
LSEVDPCEAALAIFAWDRARAMFTVKGVAMSSENEIRRCEDDMKVRRMRILHLNALRVSKLHYGSWC